MTDLYRHQLCFPVGTDPFLCAAGGRNAVAAHSVAHSFAMALLVISNYIACLRIIMLCPIVHYLASTLLAKLAWSHTLPSPLPVVLSSAIFDHSRHTHSSSLPFCCCPHTTSIILPHQGAISCVFSSALSFLGQHECCSSFSISFRYSLCWSSFFHQPLSYATS